MAIEALKGQKVWWKLPQNLSYTPPRSIIGKKMLEGAADSFSKKLEKKAEHEKEKVMWSNGFEHPS